MARKKVKLTYILNDTARKSTFQKKKVGILKKLDEITTLCGIEAFTVIYSAFDPHPHVWPSVEEARRLIMKFKSFSKIDQVKRKVNQETFTMQMLKKMEVKLKKQKRDNRHKEIVQIMFQLMINPQPTLSILNMEDREELTRVTNHNLMEVKRMMEMQNRDSSFTESSFTRPPLGGGDVSGGSDSQHLVLSHHEFMPPNHERFQSSMPEGNGNGQQEFMPQNYERSQPSSLDFSLAPNMTYLPLTMVFLPPNVTYPSPANMEFSPTSTVFPRNNMSYMNPNMEYPSNQPALPIYQNADMHPHDP